MDLKKILPENGPPINEVKKYIENELSLCAIGKKTVMSGKLNCERYIADDVAVACMDSSASPYPNNFDPEKDRRAGVYTSFFSNSLSNPCNSSDKGRISVRQNNQTDKNNQKKFC